MQKPWLERGLSCRGLKLRRLRVFSQGHHNLIVVVVVVVVVAAAAADDDDDDGDDDDDDAHRVARGAVGADVSIFASL